MKQKYQEIAMREPTLKMIAYINTIIDDYTAQGFKLSVRQIYYQLVSRALIENTEQSYKRTAKTINDGRLAGLIDWDAVEDRNRDIEVRSRWDSGASIVEGCASQFHMDMWAYQDTRAFVIVEKAALAGVLDGVCRRFDVPMLAARGYPSVSIVRELVLDHLVPAVRNGQVITILHMGDHDPSGIDMTRDLDERIQMFCGGLGVDVKIKRIALNMPQIAEKNPPPNPAKTTDARFASYERKFGDESWELDALEPAYLVNLVTTQVEKLIDPDGWRRREVEIDDVKSRLAMTANEYAEEGI